jgi:hypothetical protein
MSQTQIGFARLHSEILSHDALKALGSILKESLDPSVGDSPLRRVLKGGSEILRDSLRAQLSEGRFAEICSCGLLIESGEQIFSPFRAHLVEGFVVVTDPDAPEEMRDHLYLNPIGEAPGLAKLMLRRTVEYGLDMGCGSGVLSLVLSSFCKQVIGVDINPRALEVSRFNLALNDVNNVTIKESDLFNALAGRRFDCIVFNSPTYTEGYCYRSLLGAGEPLLARFFTNLANHLTPEGYCQINLAMNDYEDSRFSDRLSTWIAAGEHDLCSVTMVCERLQLENSQIWKRGWATLFQGRHFSSEVDWPYELLPAALSPKVGSELVSHLLENHKALNFEKQLPHLTWSGAVCCVPPESKTLCLWDIPLIEEVPEELLLSLRHNESLSFPSGLDLDYWIEQCVRKGLLQLPAC